MTLNLSNQNLTTLEGYVFPEGITFLDISYNRLTSLPPLPPTLIKLCCTDNQLTNLPSLPPSLKELYCFSNQLTSLPSLPDSLIELYCSRNQLTNLPPLPPTLIKLYCGWNKLTSLPPLSYGTVSSLTHLGCSGNQLTSIPPLPASLIEFYCNNDGLPSSYYYNGLMKPIEEVRMIILIDRLRRGCAMVSRLVSDKAARNIQRVWKRYWLEPYQDVELGYRVSRYLLHYQHQL